MDVHFGTEGVACVGEGFHYGEVGVMEFHVLAYQGDVHGLVGGEDAVHHGFPVFHVAGAVVQSQFFQGNAVKAFFLQEEGYFVNALGSEVVDDSIRFHVAEEGDFPFHVVREGLHGAAYDDVRLDADGAQFLDGVLGGLGFQFVRCFDVGHQGDVDVEYVISVRYVFLHLADGFQEGEGFDVPYGTADFGDHDVGIVVSSYPEDPVLDFIGNVGNDLDGGAQVFALSFLVDDGLVNFAGGDVGGLGQVFVDESFIVAQVQVCFGTVVGDEYFAVLVGAHGARVDIDVGIEFLDGNLVSSVLQKSAQGCGGNAFAQGRNNAAGYEDVFSHGTSL